MSGRVLSGRAAVGGDEAEAHLTAATAEHERLGSPIWQADTERLLGLTILCCPDGDADAGRALLRCAADSAD
jgi:hypothetical protein